MALNCSTSKGLSSSGKNQEHPPICQHLSTSSSEDQENSPNDGVRVITEELVNYYKNEEYPELQQIMQRINYHPDFELLLKLNHMTTQYAMEILKEDDVIDYMAKIVHKNSVFFPQLKNNVVKVNGNPIFDPVTQHILKSFAVQCNNKKEGYYFEKAQIPHDEFPESQEKRMQLMDFTSIHWIKEKYRLNRTVRNVYSKYMKSEGMKTLEFENFLKIDEVKKILVASHNCAVCETKIKIYVIINKYYMIERYGTILLKNHLNMHRQRDDKIEEFHFDSEENEESDDSFDGYVEQPMTVQTKDISDSETESELTLEMIDSKPPQIPENCAISLPGLIRS